MGNLKAREELLSLSNHTSETLSNIQKFEADDNHSLDYKDGVKSAFRSVIHEIYDRVEKLENEYNKKHSATNRVHEKHKLF